MRYEFYGRVKSEVITSRVAEQIGIVKNNYLNDPTQMIQKLQDIKETTNGKRLIRIYDRDDEVRFVKSYDNIDRDAIEKSKKVIINNLECGITNSLYDIDNGVIKYHLDKVFYREEIDEETKKEIMDKAKIDFDKEIDKLIELFEYRKERKEKFVEREPKGRLFKGIFK